MSVCYNVTDEMNLIAQHEYIKDLGIFMSADCSFLTIFLKSLRNAPA